MVLPDFIFHRIFHLAQTAGRTPFSNRNPDDPHHRPTGYATVVKSYRCGQSGGKVVGDERLELKFGEYLVVPSNLTGSAHRTAKIVPNPNSP